MKKIKIYDIKKDFKWLYIKVKIWNDWYQTFVSNKHIKMKDNNFWELNNIWKDVINVFKWK